MSIFVSPNLVSIEKNNNYFVYDSKTGNNIMLNKNSYKILKALETIKNIEILYEKCNSESMQDLIKKFYEKGFVYNEVGFNSTNSEKTKYEDIISGKYIHDLRLNVTESCNLNCIYCYEKISNQYIKRRTMSWEIAKKAIDKFTDVILKNHTESSTIRFFGGEPIINWELVKRSLEYSYEKLASYTKLNYLINTNGTLITKDISEVLNIYKVTVILSLDGVDEYNDQNRMYYDKSGSFKDIDRNLKLLAETDCEICLAVVCTNYNAPHLKKLIDYAYEIKEKYNSKLHLSLSNVHLSNKNDMEDLTKHELVNFIIDAIRYGKSKDIVVSGGNSHLALNNLLNNGERHCIGIGHELSVNPEGKISSCTAIDFTLGDIEHLDELLNSVDYINLVNRTKGRIKECQGCSIEAYCAGGCYAQYINSRDKNLLELRECEFDKLMFEELVKDILL